MIKIDFSEPDTEEWREWRRGCEAATAAMVEPFGSEHRAPITDLYKRESRHYKSLRGPFHGKCAYCEALIAADQPGDVDHFRPKGRVNDAMNHPVMIGAPGATATPHPGYYWLAYDWQNLLPACDDCNRPSTKKSCTGRLLGKWDRFPIQGTYATKPSDDLSQEAPLLINPALEDPQPHLRVENTGVCVSSSERGKTCIHIFGLNEREALVDERRRTYRRVCDTINAALASLSMLSAVASRDEIGKRVNNALTEAEQVEKGSIPYAAAGRCALREFPAYVFKILDEVWQGLNGH